MSDHKKKKGVNKRTKGAAITQAGRRLDRERSAKRSDAIVKLLSKRDKAMLPTPLVADLVAFRHGAFTTKPGGDIQIRKHSKKSPRKRKP